MKLDVQGEPWPGEEARLGPECMGAWSPWRRDEEEEGWEGS